MSKLLGILPYLYFFDQPVRLGETTLLSLPDTEGRDFAPREQHDRDDLYQLVTCFPVHRGLESDRGVIRAYSYFLTDFSATSEAKAYSDAKKVITLLRYAMLRPDSQALKDLETSAVYTFELPPAGTEKTRVYHMWANFNQEEWVTPNHPRFYPPAWDVDLQMEHTSNLEDVDLLNGRFYSDRMDSIMEARVLLAMEWYNLSFSKYTFRGVSGLLTDIATAFETLLHLPRRNKTAEFKKALKEALGITGESVLDDWAGSFYSDVRSETVHAGRPLSYAFRHPDAQTAHLSFLWSAQRIFRECVASKVGLDRHVANSHLVEDLIPNEVILAELRKAKSYQELRTNRLGIWRLRQAYPVGKMEDVIWVGNILLSEMANLIPLEDLPDLKATVDTILKTPPDEDKLWPKYVELQKQLSEILFRGNVQKAKHLSHCLSLSMDVEKYAGFAWYALQTVVMDRIQKERGVGGRGET